MHLQDDTTLALGQQSNFQGTRAWDSPLRKEMRTKTVVDGIRFIDETRPVLSNMKSLTPISEAPETSLP